MKEMICKSNRVLIRTWELEDAEAWHQLSQDEGLNRFSISGYRQPSLSGSLAFIQKWQNMFSESRTGIFPVFYKDLKTMMGVVGLKEVEFDGQTEKHIELMYRFAEPFWGKGFATEAAHGLLRYAFCHLKLKQIIAFVVEENQKSLDVLQRLGFTFDQHETFHGHPVKVFKITKQDFSQESPISFRRLSTSEVPLAQKFYNDIEYKKAIKADDVVVAAFDKNLMMGAIRLENEEGVRVLRGMQIHYKYAGRGIGKRLLKVFDNELGNHVCYCIPFSWLEGFYSCIGFKKIEPHLAPSFLQDRLEESSQTIIMKRDPA